MTSLAAAAAADDPAAMAASPVPDCYRAAVVLAADQGAFAGVPSSQRDLHQTLHVAKVPTPEPGPGEVLIAVMASSINYNTVWTAMFEPVSTFRFLTAFGRTSAAAPPATTGRIHVVGSDAAGVVLRIGPGVTSWRPGDQIVIMPARASRRARGPRRHAARPDQRAWGYETNFGGLAELALVQATQLMPKPAHLSWEEAACLNLSPAPLTGSSCPPTARR